MMKQTINLLPVKVKQTINWLAFNHLLAVLALVLITCLTFSGYLAFKAADIETKLAAQKQFSDGVKNNLTILNDEYRVRSRESKTAHVLVQQQQQLQALQQMQEILAQQNIPVSAGFLSTIKGVQGALPDGAKLEAFKISQGQQLSLLRGSLGKATDLPALIENLRSAGLLKEQQLQKISSLNAGDHQQFEIVSAQKELGE